MQQNEVQRVERTDRPNALGQRSLAVPVERLEREAAAVDLATFAHELRELVVEVLVAREGIVAETREATLHAERDAWAVEKDRRLETLAKQAGRLQQVHEADGTLEGDSVKRDEGFFPRFGLHVLEHLLLVVDEEIALLVVRNIDCRHIGSPWGDRGPAARLERSRTGEAPRSGTRDRKRRASAGRPH